MFRLVILISFLFTQNSFADLQFEQFQNSGAAERHLEDLSSKISGALNKDITLEVDEFIFTGSDILDYDKKTVTASSMCDCNYIQVFFTPKEKEDLLCSLLFEGKFGRYEKSGVFNCLYQGNKKIIFPRGEVKVYDYPIDIDSILR